MTDRLMLPRRESDRFLRPLPAGFVRPTRYRWPTQARDVPKTCGHCGALLLIEAPTAEHVLADVTCWRCSRVACELFRDGTRPAPETILCECGERYPRGDRCEPCAARRVQADRMRAYRARKAGRS